MSEELKNFIEQAKKDGHLRKQLEGCSVDSWGASHTPIDVDPKKVVEVALAAGYAIEIGDVVAAQCQQLEQFWRFEMENSFVARRSLARLQVTISGSRKTINYYGYQR